MADEFPVSAVTFSSFPIGTIEAWIVAAEHIFLSVGQSSDVQLVGRDRVPPVTHPGQGATKIKILRLGCTAEERSEVEAMVRKRWVRLDTDS